MELFFPQYFDLPDALSIAGMGIILIFLYFKRWLSAPGSIAAFVLGATIIFCAGLYFILPMLLFFCSGSLSARLNKSSHDASGRNALQVLANGSVAAICIVLYSFLHDNIFLLGYFVSINVSLSDTMSSDFGIFYRQNTFDIITLKAVQAGLSGGISFAGTLAGIFSSVLFTVIISFLFELTYVHSIIICTGGIGGMLTDSVIGSLWQAKYQHGSIIDEEVRPDSRLIKGLHWMNNDMVNVLSNFVVTFTSIILLSHL